MAKLYGDLPCVNLNGTIHITKSATKCLCGMGYKYSHPDREGNCVNIIWREIDAVTCDECRKIKEDSSEYWQ